MTFFLLHLCKILLYITAFQNYALAASGNVFNFAIYCQDPSSSRTSDEYTTANCYKVCMKISSLMRSIIYILSKTHQSITSHTTKQNTKAHTLNSCTLSLYAYARTMHALTHSYLFLFTHKLHKPTIFITKYTKHTKTTPNPELQQSCQLHLLFFSELHSASRDHCK